MPTSAPVRVPSSTRRSQIVARLAALSQNAWFAYATILLLQLKVAWGMWAVRDLTSGDTSSYFVIAWKWYRGEITSIVWSPLYTSFYSLFFHLSHDAFTVTTAHRLAIVLILDILVLAVMRILLPKPLAWLMAAWWVVLPIDFDALYEVHLFAVIPMLLAALMVHWIPGRRGRGWALGILFAAGLLMRNELLVAAGLFAVFAAICEMREVKARRPIAALTAYGIPVAGAILLALFFYARAEDRPVLTQMVGRKHTLNICQAFTFGYQQRHPDWKGSPWTDCQQIMMRVFGAAEPSFEQATVRNPRAMLGHFEWNLRLLPDGLEVLLFNAAFGASDPDYAPIHSGSRIALALAIICLSILLSGTIRLWRRRRVLWSSLMGDRLPVWVVLGCLSAVVLMVIAVERPRPSYMFILGITIRASIGLCIVAIAGARREFAGFSAALPVVAILAVLAVPSYYELTASHTPQTLLRDYRRLLPFESVLQKPRTRLVSGGFGSEICNYLGKGADCSGLYYWGLRNRVRADLPLSGILEQNGANVFYADEAVMADPMARSFVDSAAAFGWKTIGMQDEGGDRWTMLRKISPPRPRPVNDIMAGRFDIRLGAGWYAPETAGGLRFRWANNDAVIVIPPCKPVDYIVYLDIEPGPGIFQLPLHLRVTDSAGDVVKTAQLSGRETIEIPLPPTSGQIVLKLHADGGEKPTPRDPRILNFRAFRIELQ